MNRYIHDHTDNNLERTWGPERVFAARIASSAVDYADRVSVTIPGTDGGHLRWEDVRWQPRLPGQLPQRDNECVVVLDDNNELWIVAWWNDDALPATVEAKRFIGTGGNPAFTNSWVNFGSGFQTTNFYKDPFGRVFLEGQIKDGTLNQSAFTLPAGYRPSAGHIFFASAANTANRVDVYNDGTVYPLGTDNDYVSLNGISFVAA